MASPWPICWGSAIKHEVGPLFSHLQKMPCLHCFANKYFSFPFICIIVLSLFLYFVLNSWSELVLITIVVSNLNNEDDDWIFKICTNVQVVEKMEEGTTATSPLPP